MAKASKKAAKPSKLKEHDASLPLLAVKDLTVEFATRRGIVRAVEHVDLTVAKGETLAIVGESGSGKSVTSYAVMRILDRAGRIAEGSVTFSGLDLRATPESDMRDLRGREMSMIFQSPRLALNPIRKVGRQIEDVLLAARPGRQRGGKREGDRDARAGAHRAAARALPCLSVRAPRRHVPARRHRAGARLPAATADRRRADHRPRRHHAEGGDGSRRRADARARHVDHPHHPRPRPRRRLLQPRDGDGEGPRGGDRGLRPHLQKSIARLYPQTHARDAPSRGVVARSFAGRASGEHDRQKR